MAHGDHCGSAHSGARSRVTTGGGGPLPVTAHRNDRTTDAEMRPAAYWRDDALLGTVICGGPTRPEISERNGGRTTISAQ